MEWLKSKAPIVAFCSLALIALEGYAIISIKKSTRRAHDLDRERIAIHVRKC